MTPYDELCSLTREIAILSSTASVLGWDQETYMPQKGLSHRAQQLSFLNSRAHDLATSARFQSALDAAESEGSQSSVQQANVGVWRHELERAKRIPTALVAEESEITSHAKHVWAEAREHSNFGLFAPHLEKIVDLTRRKADLWGYKDEPYDALLTAYERGAATRSIAELFTKLKPQVSSIAKTAVATSKALPKHILRGSYPIAKQKCLNREIAESLGFNFQAGRIDTTAHPFCTTLGPGDIRLTTRYDETDFTSSLFGVLHETGHGLYEQGLPENDFGLPSGSAVSLGIHESQSRLWENHVGRSEAFWEKWLPRAAELFPDLRKVSPPNFLRAIHRSEFSCIRVEADEATYDLHIILRFELERRLLNGTLSVAETPDAWNAEFESLFGFIPPDDAHGCLQDIHWSMGGIGYFATYTLGNLNSAQLYASALADEGVAKAARQADYIPLLAWLRNSVHSKGSTLLPNDLMLSATGSVTQPTPYLNHLHQRFGTSS